MFTADVSRSYKNFRSDPLDWPLLVLGWNGAYYLDTTMPFGARASSSNMQRVANAVVKILKDKGVNAMMYLDDIIVIAETKLKAEADYRCVNETPRPTWTTAGGRQEATPGKVREMAGSGHRCRRDDPIHT